MADVQRMNFFLDTSDYRQLMEIVFRQNSEALKKQDRGRRATVQTQLRQIVKDFLAKQGSK